MRIPAPPVDVVVVSYNSVDRLRGCVEPFAPIAETRVIVVDNASQDGSLGSVADLPVDAVQLTRNGGFAHGCNAGWRLGSSPYVLFLNPDARIEPEAVTTLARRLDADESIGAIGPRIMRPDGAVDFSIRRLPRLGSRYAQALFIHRLFPRAAWVDEVVRDPAVYERRGNVEWISGACLLVRRDVLEALGGFDESFFMYCEDVDLCYRIKESGRRVCFEPDATCVHEGGGSAPRPSLLPVLASSRVRYAKKHFGTTAQLAERAGLALAAFTHMLVGRGGRAVRIGHLRSLQAVLEPGGAARASHPARSLARDSGQRAVEATQAPK